MHWPVKMMTHKLADSRARVSVADTILNATSELPVFFTENGAKLFKKSHKYKFIVKNSISGNSVVANLVRTMENTGEIRIRKRR